MVPRTLQLISAERPNQITGANSRCAGQSDGCWSYDVVVADASALPAAVAQFHRWGSNDGHAEIA
jgi:hypothetical protein